MSKGNFFKKVDEKKVESKTESKVSQKIQFDINYVIITAPDPVSLSTKVNDYLEKFKNFCPLGGVCFVSDNGENYFLQSMYNGERGLNS